MGRGEGFEELLAWFTDPDVTDEGAIAARLREIAPALWPGFSAEAAAELADREQSGGDRALIERKKRLLGEERRHREPPEHHHTLSELARDNE